MSKLQIGCGDNILKGYVNLDVFKRPGVDVVHDMNKFPWPFDDNTFEEVYASHILEHVDDLLSAMREIHRICHHNARVVVRAPHFSCGVTYRDPTHKRAMSYFSFDYFCEAENQYKRQDEGLFLIVSKKLNFTRLACPWLNIIFNPIINISPTIYERFFCWLLPCSEVLVELEAVKHGASIGTLS